MSLLDDIRKACLSATWSQGVKLAREGAVHVEARSPSEITARVRAAGAPIAPTVVLYLEDGEWACDCGGKVDPCAHVAAAIIAADKAPAAPVASASPAGASTTSAAAGPPAQIVYDLSRHAGTLFLERALRFADGREEPLAETVLALVARGDTRVMPTHDDLAVDRLASGFERGVVRTAKVTELLRALEASPNVRLDGIPVRTRRDPVAPDVVVEDGPGGGVIVRATRPAFVREVVAAGVVRTEGDELRPLAAVELTGEQLERLPLVREVSRRELGELATRVLPELDRHTAVDVRTSRVPGRRARVKPRVAIELDTTETGVSALALIVYGDPPVARVDGDALTFLGGAKDAAPVRDTAAERALVHRLRDELNVVPGKRVSVTGQDAARFLSRVRAWSEGEVRDRGRLFSQVGLVPRVVTEGDRVEVFFEEERSEGEARRASAEQVVWAARQGLDVVPLEGGGFAQIPREFLATHGAALADLLAASGRDGTIARAAAHLAARFCEALDLPVPPTFAELRKALDRDPREDALDLPSDLDATLRHYQEDGVRWLTLLRRASLGGILADDMGLGKTLQALAALRGRALVVCPTSVLFNWEREIARFRPGLRVNRFHGPGRSLDGDADVTLTSYGTLRADADALSRRAFDVVVLDEAQAIKNPDSQSARAAFSLRATTRVALSGTPIENRLEELFSLMHFANPGLLGGRPDFRARYEEPIARGDSAATARLRELVRPFVLRRLKRDVAPELPPRTEDVMWVELTAEERAVYDTVRAATQRDLVEAVDGGRGVLAALEALLRLRQAACHPGLLPGRQAETSSKVERLVGELAAAVESGHKALVFSQWTSLLDRVEPALSAAGIAFTRLDGATRDRESVVSTFQRDDGPPVLLLSLKAGGTGLNLTAADHVFLLDPWWNPAAEDQAADRAHRIGQDKPVFVHRLVTRDTVEARVLALQEHKRGLVDAALGGDRVGALVTREELLALLA